MTIGERISLLRKKSGLSQEKLAELVGVSRQAIGKWESGLSLPGIDNLQELAKVLGVSCDELITGTPSVTPDTPKSEAYIAVASVRDLLAQQSITEHKGAQRRLIFLSIAFGLVFLLSIGGIALHFSSAATLEQLSARLSGLESQIAGLQGQLYLPQESSTPGTSTLIADYECKYTLLPSGDAVNLRVSVLPKSLTEGQSAQFSVIADGQNLTVPAQVEGGEFWAELEIPLTNDFNSFKVSFLLDQPNGETAQELLFTEVEFITQYTLRLVLEPDDFAVLPQSDGSWAVGGRMALTVECCENRYPVAGVLELVVDGKTVQTEQMDDRIFDSFPGEEDGSAVKASAAVCGFTSYHYFAQNRYKAADASSIILRATLTDNLGKSHTVEWTAG